MLIVLLLCIGIPVSYVGTGLFLAPHMYAAGDRLFHSYDNFTAKFWGCTSFIAWPIFLMIRYVLDNGKAISSSGMSRKQEKRLKFEQAKTLELEKQVDLQIKFEKSIGRQTDGRLSGW